MKECELCKCEMFIEESYGSVIEYGCFCGNHYIEYGRYV